MDYIGGWDVKTLGIAFINTGAAGLAHVVIDSCNKFRGPNHAQYCEALLADAITAAVLETRAQHLIAVKLLKSVMAIMDGDTLCSQQPIIELKAHGCLTGDCPHDNANDCLKALTAEINKLPGDLEGGGS